MSEQNPDPVDPPEEAADEPDLEAEREEVETERRARLDADNRPEGVEIDNTQRDFDAEKGLFTDDEGFDEAEVRFPPAEEQAT